MPNARYHLNLVERAQFAANLQAIMDDRGVKPIDVARGIGLPNSSAVCLWKDGRGVPSPDVLKTLAHWLRVSPHLLLPNGAATRTSAKQYVKVQEYVGGVTVQIRVSAKDLASVMQLIECAEKLGVTAE
jgi:transcriptional regulator with XRE-family HTH domain